MGNSAFLNVSVCEKCGQLTNEKKCTRDGCDGNVIKKRFIGKKNISSNVIDFKRRDLDVDKK